MKYSEVTDTERFYGCEQEGMKKYCSDPRFSNNQLEVIRYGIESGVDVTPYAHPDIRPNTMMTILMQLRERKRYHIRYTRDGGDTISVSAYFGSTKQEAINSFSADYAGAEIVDVREEGGESFA